MLKTTTWALGASLLAAAPALHAAAQKNVDVRLSIANPVVQGDVDVGHPGHEACAASVNGRFSRFVPALKSKPG